MEDDYEPLTPDLSRKQKQGQTIPWGALIVVIIVVSFGVSVITGFLLGDHFNAWLEERLSEADIPGVTTTVEVTEEESATIAAVEKTQPAVVSIVVTKDISQIYEDTYGNELFPFFFSTPGEQEGSQEIGGGTGFFISSDGMLLTNKHVVQDANADYSVILQDGTRYDNVTVLARDPIEDMAVLKVDDGDDFPALEFGDSDALKVGQTVIAIGNSLGQYQNSVTKGIVSGLGRDITAGDSFGQSSERLQNIIQTDAAINQGNSGGPLINLAGQVVGINTAVDYSGQLVGFALPINGFKDEIESVRESGEIVKPYLGVRYAILTAEIAEQNDLDYDYGALVLRGREVGALAVVPGSPADKAGIVENDIILEINGTQINEDNDLSALIQTYQVGDKLTLKIVHDGSEKEIEVILEKRSTDG